MSWARKNAAEKATQYIGLNYLGGIQAKQYFRKDAATLAKLQQNNGSLETFSKKSASFTSL